MNQTKEVGSTNEEDYIRWMEAFVNAKKWVEVKVEGKIKGLFDDLMAALGWLLKNSDNVTQKEIADHSNTDRMMVSKILRTLQKNELIKRKEHETDTRAKCVLMTEKGIDTLQKAIEIKNNSNNLFFEKLKDKQKFGNELRNIAE